MSKAQHPKNTNALKLKHARLELRAVADLHLPKNIPYKHTARSLNKHARSTAYFQFMMPPLLDEDSGEVIGGFEWVQVAQELGLDEIQVLVTKGWSDAKIKAYRIAEKRLSEDLELDETALVATINEILADDPETDLSVTGFEIPEIDGFINVEEFEETAEAEEDLDIPDPANAVTRLGDLWQAGAHKIMCADARDSKAFSQLLNGTSVPLAVIDPPWNRSIAGDVGGSGKTQHREFVMASGEMSDEAFELLLRDSILAIRQALTDGGLLYVVIDWAHSEQVMRVGRKLGLKLINICVWNKTNAGMGGLYRSQHELVVVFKKGKAPHRNNNKLGAYGRSRSNVWNFPGMNSFGPNRMALLRSHPTVKPVSMIAEIMKDVTARGDLVMDTFNGSGTLLLAAQQTGRTARCIELDPLYVDLALRRFERRFEIEPILTETNEPLSVVRARRARETE